MDEALEEYAEIDSVGGDEPVSNDAIESGDGYDVNSENAERQPVMFDNKARISDRLLLDDRAMDSSGRHHINFKLINFVAVVVVILLNSN